MVMVVSPTVPMPQLFGNLGPNPFNLAQNARDIQQGWIQGRVDWRQKNKVCVGGGNSSHAFTCVHT